MIRPWHKLCLLGIVVSLAVFAGPMIICKLDIRNSALDAADILSYYGTILSACIAIMTLIITIKFTQKQIQRETYLANKTETWEKVENIFAKALDGLNPMRPVLDTADCMTNPGAAILKLQRYRINCKIANDQLLAYLSNIDYPHVKTLIDAMNKSSEAFCAITKEIIAACDMQRDFSHRDMAEQTLRVEAKSPGAVDEDTLIDCKAILEKNKSYIT